LISAADGSVYSHTKPVGGGDPFAGNRDLKLKDTALLHDLTQPMNHGLYFWD